VSDAEFEGGDGRGCGDCIFWSNAANPAVLTVAEMGPKHLKSGLKCHPNRWSDRLHERKRLQIDFKPEPKGNPKTVKPKTAFG
jgi:hypothetical protein